MGFDVQPFYLDTSRFDNALGDMFGAIKKKREDEASLGLINALGSGGDPSMGTTNALASPSPSMAPLAPSAPNVPAVLQAGYGRESGPGATGTNLVDAIKGFEGYTPKSQWDYKQYSIGYGTRGAPGEVIDKPEAERRLGTEIGKARSVVEQFAPNAPPGIKDALTSLTFNSGADWTRAGLGAAVQRGDWQDAKSRFLQYNRAGGSVNPGLVSRRNQEASWFDGGAPQAAQPAQAQPVRVADASGGISPQVMAWMRANPSHPMTREIMGKIAEQRLDPMAGLRTQKAQLDVQNAITEQQRGHLDYFGKKALAISQMDPATAAQVWPRVLAEHKQLFPNDEITAEEADPVTGPKMMMAEAGLFNDPRVKEKGDLELEKMRAEVEKTKREATGGSKYGLQPVYGVDGNGNPVIMQLGPGGEAVATKMPNGVTLDLAAKSQAQAAGKERGEAMGKAQVDLRNQEDNAALILDTIDQIKSHPGRETGTGWMAPMGMVPGTAARGFKGLVDQLKGQAFLDAFNSLRGGGQITEVEGAKATAARARLDTAQTKEDFDKALDDFERVVRTGLARSRAKASGTASPQMAAPAMLDPAAGLRSKYGLE